MIIIIDDMHRDDICSEVRITLHIVVKGPKFVGQVGLSANYIAAFLLEMCRLLYT